MNTLGGYVLYLGIVVAIALYIAYLEDK